MASTSVHNGRGRLSRTAMLRLLVAVAAVATLVTVLIWRANHQGQPSPRAQGYTSVGSVNGQTYWLRQEPGHRLGIRTTGKGGCNESGAYEVTGVPLCSDGVNGLWTYAVVVQPGATVSG